MFCVSSRLIQWIRKNELPLVSVTEVNKFQLGFSLYHAVIFHFLLRNKYNGLLNPDPPLKSTTPFGAKITRVDSTLETAPPPLFLNPVS